MLITKMKGRSTLQKFSHIYVEKDVLDHPITKKILGKFHKSIIVKIDKYGDVFNRPHQSYIIQKEAQNLIIAKKRYDFIYRGSELCEDFGNANFYHTSNILNCIYDCDYCYLQGMYPSANLVFFVNIEDYFKEVDKLTINQKIYLSISYEADLLALENLTGFAGMWIDYAKKNRNVKIEIRTKSANFHSFYKWDIPDNVIFAWSILPQPVIDKYEHLTPTLDMRIKSINCAISRGLKVRLSIEPIMPIDNFEHIYREFIKKLFSSVAVDGIRDVNIGVFRMVKEQAKKIEKLKEHSLIFCYNTIIKDGIFTYEDEEYLKNFVYNEVIKHQDKGTVLLS